MVRPSKRRRTDGGASTADTELVKAKKPVAPQVDGSEDDDDVPEKRLRFVDILTEVPNGDAAAATELALSGRGLTEAESLESCRNLRKLELKDNKLSDLGFLEMNHELCWLGVAKNRLESIAGLANLASLAVLDLSDNRLVRLDGLAGLTGLKALIVARNRITRVEGLSPKRNALLETLVLSHNRITECNMAPFPTLKKLSLANNQLHAFPGLAPLPQLTELRLNGNRISALTQQLRQPRLSILDVGNNLLAKVEALEPLKGLLWIKSLNLLGNPIAQDMEDSSLKGILEAMPRLEIVNNRRLQHADKLAQKKKGRRRSKGHSADDTGNAAWGGHEAEGGSWGNSEGSSGKRDSWWNDEWSQGNKKNGKHGRGDSSKQRASWPGWQTERYDSTGTAPPEKEAAVAHGGVSEGKRSVSKVFNDSDDEGGNVAAPKVKKKKKRKLLSSGAGADADDVVRRAKKKRKVRQTDAGTDVDASTQKRTGGLRPSKRMKKRKHLP